MWVHMSYNRCLYQDGDWREDHFAELENGMLVVYAVTKAPSGIMSRIKSIVADDIEMTMYYEDEHNLSRSVILLAGSARTKDLWVRYLSDSCLLQGSKDTVVFESVVIKSPTKDQGHMDVQASPRRRDSFTNQWDAITSFMGAWHRRLFRLFGDGSLSYHEVVPVACVSLASASSIACVELSPKSFAGEQEMWALTLCSSFGDATLPKPPAEPIPSLGQVSRRLSRVVGSLSSKNEEKTGSVATRKEVSSAVSIGSPSGNQRDQWLRQIQQYSAWFARESLADSSDSRRTKVITKGWGWKKGQMSFSAWKPRFFVLLSNREMVYYDAAIGKEPLGIIDLRKKKEVRLSKSVDKPQGFEEILEIETSNRTWYFSPKAQTRGEHSAELKNWLRAISDSEENFEKHHSFERTGSFTFSSNSFFESDTQEDPTTLPVVRLDSWQRFSGNVPEALLSPSPSKVELILHGVVSGENTRRKSIVDPTKRPEIRELSGS